MTGPKVSPNPTEICQPPESTRKQLTGLDDNLPEQAFYLVGGIEEAVAKAKTVT